MKSRRERREEARKNGVPFEPQYNSGVRFVVSEDKKGEIETVKTGGAPKTFEEAYGVGYERFNNKFVTIREVEEEIQVEAVEETVTEEEN